MTGTQAFPLNLIPAIVSVVAMVIAVLSYLDRHNADNDAQRKRDAENADNERKQRAEMDEREARIRDECMSYYQKTLVDIQKQLNEVKSELREANNQITRLNRLLELYRSEARRQGWDLNKIEGGI